MIALLIKEKRNTTPHVIVYYLSLNTCSDLYAHFHYELGPASYFTPGSPQNRLYIILCQQSTEQQRCDPTEPDGVVRIVFATVACGMGIDLQGVNTIIHYGALDHKVYK